MANMDGINENSSLNIPDELKPKKIKQNSHGRPTGSKDFSVVWRDLQELKNIDADERVVTMSDIIYELEVIALNRDHPDQFKALTLFMDRFF
jgi:hypothetical protein